MKKGIKKYYPGVSGLTNFQSGPGTGTVLAPPIDPNGFSTGKMLFPKQETLGKIVDNKVMSQDYLDKAKPSFSDKAGAAMGNYGGAITQAAGTLMPLLMKKPDPNAKPYKTGTNMIKYQGNKLNTKTSKSKFIKYQEGNEYLQSGKGMSNVLNAMEENNNNLSNASIKPEKFDMASLNDYMPDIPQRQSPQPIEVGPSKKEIARLMREYNKKEFEAGKFGYMDKSDPRYKQLATRNEANAARGEYEKLYSQNENDYKKLKNNYKELEPLSTKTPLLNLKLAQSAELPSNLNKIPVKEQSRKERKAENKKLEGMAKAPITYNENSFVGPPQFVGPSDQELQLGRTREDAQAARNLYEAKQKGTPMTDALIKKSMSSQAFKDVTSKKSLQQKYNENKGGYANALKSGKVNAKGFLVDPNTGLEYEDLRKKSSGKQAQSTTTAKKESKPTAKGNTPKGPFFKDGVAINKFKDPATGRSYYTNNRIFDEKTGRMGKYNYDEKINKVITQWDKTDPNSNSNRRVYPGESPLVKYKNLNNTKNNTQENKTARHTTDDAGKKMVNPYKSTVESKIQQERANYKKSQEQEQANLRQQGVNAMEKLKKENPQAYDFQMRLNAKREALKAKK
jgi:hypothetical protein